jgi:biotin operon repressor
MPFERSLEIERRLDQVLRLIRTGRYSTPMLAKELVVSIPTISRCVTALRQRGHDIRAENQGDSWRYVLASKTVGSQKFKSGPFAQAATRIHEQNHHGK